MKEKKTGYDAESTKSERMKTEVSRRRRKKRLAEVRLGLILMLLILIIGVVFSIFYFKAKKITVVNSAVRYSDAEIAAAAAVDSDESLLLLNTKAVEARILKQLPYVGSVTVKRHIPDEVVITVEYTKATLAVETNEGYVLMNSEGKVLQTGVKRLADYTAVVYGSFVKEAVPGEQISFETEGFFDTLMKLVAEFESNGYNNVTAYDLNDLSDVVVEINFYINVQFGSVNRLSGKLRFAKATIDSQLQKGGVNAPKTVVELIDGNTAIARTQSAIEASKEAARRNKFLASLSPEELESLEAAEKGSEAAGEETTGDEYDDGYDGDYDEGYDEDDDGYGEGDE